MLDAISVGSDLGNRLVEEAAPATAAPTTLPEAVEAAPVEAASAGPYIEEFRTLKHPTVAAQMVFVTGQEKPFVIPLKLLAQEMERFEPLRQLNVGDSAPVGLLREAHKEALRFFPEIPQVPTRSAEEMERGEKALEQIRAEKDAREKARREALEEAKGLDAKMAAQRLKEAIDRLDQGKLKGFGLLGQLLTAFQEGRIDGLLAAERIKSGVAKAADATVAVASTVARGAGTATALTGRVASTVLRKPGAAKQELADPHAALDTLVQKSMLERVEFFNTLGEGGKTQFNAELKFLTPDDKGACLVIKDAEGKNISKDVAKANKAEYNASLDAVTLKGRAFLRGPQDQVVKLVVPALQKAGHERPSVSYFSMLTPDFAAAYRQHAATETAKAAKAAGPKLKDKSPERGAER
ncbi:hypothetical protein [Ramlibacter alkalitolerans]|uniref:Uncharacterized protein n=1 Tax=Ramlibacter alkalitolerans TaxID=2039631 RepID=A0ABS1JU41_9BURK|nr:hypothetical protein [Ramlibacter alkalitolerans]MBL0427810.1 hypothetical protein [Ramlibacter alkalitolerans]